MTNTDIQEYSGIPDLNMVCVHKKKKKLGGKIMPGMIIWPVCHFLSQWNHKNSYAWVTSSKKASKKHHYRLDSEHVWNLLPIGNFPINRYHSPLTPKEAWKVWGDECYRKIVQLKQDETGKPREEQLQNCCAVQQAASQTAGYCQTPMPGVVLSSNFPCLNIQRTART